MKSFLEIVVNYRHAHPEVQYKDCELAWQYHEYQQEILATQALIHQKNNGRLSNNAALQAAIEKLRALNSRPVRPTHSAKRIYDQCLCAFERQLKVAS